MKFLYFFLLLLVIFALLDPDPDSEVSEENIIVSIIIAEIITVCVVKVINWD